MKKEKQIQINTNIVLREETDDWALLFDPDTGDVVGINPVGVFIWKCLEKHLSLPQIILEIKSKFDATPETVEDDVGIFLEGLRKRGFIAEDIIE